MELVNAALPAWMRRDQYTVGEVLTFSLSRFNKYRGKLVEAALLLGLVYLLALGATTLLEIVAGASPFSEGGTRFTTDPLAPAGYIAGMVIRGVINTIMYLGFFVIAFEVIHDRSPATSTLFKPWNKFLRYFGASIAQGCIWAIAFIPGTIVAAITLFAARNFMVLPKTPFELLNFGWHQANATGLLIGILGLSLALIVVLYIGLGASFIALEVIYNDKAKLNDAIRWSWLIAKNHRNTLYKLALLTFLLNACGFLALGIGLLFTFPLTSLIWCSQFLSLRNGANVPAAEYSLQRYSA